MGNKHDIYAVVDLETTSTQNKFGRIIQVAVAFVQNKKVINQFTTLVNPGTRIPITIQKLTNIDDQTVEQAPYFEDISQMLHAMLVGTIFVAHNVNFDLPFLNAEFQRVGLTELDNQAIDTVTLAQILWPTAPSYRLSDMTQLLGIEHTNPHRADSDAVATGMLLVAAIEKAEQLPMITLQELSDLPLVLPRETKLIFQKALTKNQEQPQLLPKQLQVIDRLAIRRFSDPAPYNVGQIAPYPQKEADKKDLFGDQLEYRKDQAKLMNLVYQHYTQDELSDEPGETALVIEAPTGMGKTLGYLVPLAFLANETDKQVVITVPTITLQHQVVATINQQLKAILPFEVRGAQLKGARNYLNLQSFKRSLLRDEGSIAMQFVKAQILVWLTETLTGDFDELNVNNVSSDFMEQLAQTANNPEASKFYGHEFEERQHVLAQNATFLVVNHAYLTQSVGRLGNRENKPYLVIDEAQNLPDVVIAQSRHHLTFPSWLSRVQAEIDLLQSTGQPSVRAIFERMIGGPELKDRFNENLNALLVRIPQIQQSLYRRFVMNIHTPATVGQEEHPVAGHQMAEFMMEHQSLLNEMHKAVLNLQRYLNAMMEQFIDSQEAFSTAERQSLADFRRMLDLIENNEKTLVNFQDDLANYPDASVFWITDNHGQNNLSLRLSGGLLHTRDYFKTRVYPNFMPPLITGATLFTTTKSSYLYTRLNLNQDSAYSEKFKEVFDFENQAELIMVSDAPSPSHQHFMHYFSDQLLKLMQGTDRNTLVLFTSLEMLQQVFHTMTSSRIYRDTEMTLLAQGISGTRPKLLKRMQNERHVMVLGAMSFWEGVDLPGNSLEMVVLARLPFDQPNTVLQKAEDAMLQNEGKHIFHQSVLPKAILKLRQGIGRLIRSETDRGVIVIYDNRILQKQYGKTMRNMLPDAMPQLELKTNEVLPALRDFFKKDK